MSFDVFLIRATPPPSEASKMAALSKLMERIRAINRDAIHVTLKQEEKGPTVEVFTDGYDGSFNFAGGAFWLHGLNSLILEIMFTVSLSTDLVLIAAMRNNCFILTHERQRANVPKDSDIPVVVCPSAHDLGLLLRDGYRQWADYRDQIVKSVSPGN